MPEIAGDQSRIRHASCDDRTAHGVCGVHLFFSREDHRVGKSRCETGLAGEVHVLDPPGQVVGRRPGRRETAVSRAPANDVLPW